MALTPGTRLGPYEILAPIGAGGMGEVYKASDSRLDRIVAVKVLTDPSNSRMQQEARAIAALNHPHICQIFDIGPDFFVMEFLEGHTLKGPIPLTEALRLGGQIAWALEAAHARGILHRDLKPGNVLVTHHGLAKLLDFGLARITKASGSDVTQTSDGVVMGTAPYMSPEQAQGRALDSRSDMFSFGAVLYELIAGKRAFPGHTMAEVLSALLRDDPVLPGAPASVRDIVSRCLRKNPAERYANMAEVRTAIEYAAQSLHGPSGDAPTEALVPSAVNKSVITGGEGPSIAVLPFTNMSNDPEQVFFSDGLAEEIINALSGLKGLRVIGRASSFRFRGQQDPAQVADALRVESVLDGSVRRAGNRVRITAQLIRVDGSLMWSERFDRQMDDIFAIQDEISQAVVAKLKLQLTESKKKGADHKPKIEAYDSYLKGWYHLHKATPPDLEKAQEYFELAISQDPAYADAYTGLAWAIFTFSATGLRSAREVHIKVQNVLLKALELDHDSVEVKALLGVLRSLYDFDWKGGQREIERALASGGLSIWARVAYIRWILWPSGRLDEAVRLFAEVQASDPLNPTLSRIQGDLAFIGGNFAEALEYYRAATLAEAGFWMGHVMMGWCSLRMKRPDQASIHFGTAEQLQPHHPMVACAKACLHAASGREPEARAILAGLVQRRQRGFFSAYLLGLICAHLGDQERMFEFMEQALEERDPLVFWFISGAWFANLADHPSYQKLRAKANLG
jgi:serine/threonine-protein kinase